MYRKFLADELPLLTMNINGAHSLVITKKLLHVHVEVVLQQI